MARLEDIIKQFTPRLTPDEEYDPTSVHSEFVTGSAGSGKTYRTQRMIEENPKWGLLCATTGIAAINLGAVTLNSALKYFDTDNLRDIFNRGRLTSTLHAIGKKTKRLVIDEVSMMDGRQLDYIFQAMLQVNQFHDMEGAPMGIVLTGDFCQLSPVKAPWVFEAECWEHFERNTIKLETQYRQSNGDFLRAVNAARAGNGGECVEILQSLKVRFSPSTLAGFDGTTIIAKNDQVDNFNFSALLALKEEFFGLKSAYWGDEAKEWRKNIPDVLKLKLGAYVMLMVNDWEQGFANGDCGHIVERTENGTIMVKLKRNEKVVAVNPIERYNSVRGISAEKLGLTDPYANGLVHIRCEKSCGHSPGGIKKGPWGVPSYNCSSESYNVGAVKFYPIRAAYATTVHKSQGLTLDTCQIDCRDQFFGGPNMAYVALSRVRSNEGLVIAGSPEKLAERIRIDGRVKRWL